MNRRRWNSREEKILEMKYQDPTIFPKDIAKMLGRTLSQVYGKAQKMGLKAPMERIRLAGKIGSDHPNRVAHQFKKGNVPPNKGKKVSPEMYERMSHTMFSKGQQPFNHREVGDERVNVEGYIEIKVAEPKTWRLKHRVVWEQHNGKIPPGMNIQFRNHNKQDCRIENLYIISKADQLKHENSYFARYPKEMQDVIRLKGVVNRKIHKLQKEQDNER